MNQAGRTHIPVMVNEVIDYLRVRPGAWYLDATLGQGGHARMIMSQGGRVFGIDRDPKALAEAEHYLASWSDRLVLRHGSFAELRELTSQAGVTVFAGALFDLGVSSHQLDDPARGFSFRSDGPLDMRMDPGLQVTAADLLNGLTKNELTKLFQTLGEEERARRVADALVRRRHLKPIQRTLDLAGLVSEIPGYRRGGIHPATKIFQALRIAVNDELNELKAGLPQAVALLGAEGRLAVISFHSLEDRIVKTMMRHHPELKVLTKKPVRPTVTEIAGNPRSRSAKLRVAERIKS